ncbi:MAG: hypothetical protein ACOYNZ_02145 [Rhodoferax sp.]
MREKRSADDISSGRESKHCEQCRHFGHWLPVQIGDQIDYSVHCWCRLHKNVTTDPANGCEFWLEKEKTIPAN